MNFSLGIGIVIVHPHTLGFGRKRDPSHYSHTQWLWDECVKLDVPRIILLDQLFEINSASQMPTPPKISREWVPAAERLKSGFDKYFRFKEKLKSEANLVLHTSPHVETVVIEERGIYAKFLDHIYDSGVRNLLFAGGYYDSCLTGAADVPFLLLGGKILQPYIVWDISAGWPNFAAIKRSIESSAAAGNWAQQKLVTLKQIRSQGLEAFARSIMPEKS